MLPSIVLFLISQLFLFATASDEVTSLPGLNFHPSFRHYSGYIEARSGSFLHYWFFESQDNPAKDPVVLWLNGGPGCSSLLGVLTENGPLRLEKNKTITLNPFGWNQKANILYLESPAGVGFSYRDDGRYHSNDNSTAEDNFEALKSFFKKYPQYEQNDFYITGESYGGIYVPMLSYLVTQNKFPPKFKAAAIGNGLLDVELNVQSLAHFMYHHGFVDSVDWNQMTTHCCAASPDIENCNFYSSRKQGCQNKLLAVQKQMYPKQLNRYNVYAECEAAAMKKVEEHRQMVLRSLDETGRVEEHLRLTPPCYDLSHVASYLNEEPVKKALHINSKAEQWTPCSDVLSYSRLHSTMKPQFEYLLDSGKKLLVYNGDFDSACNYLGDQWFVERLKRKEITRHEAWYLNGQIGGIKKVYENLTFMTIRGAGHMVPTDKPAEALDMFSKFLSGEVFN